MSWFAMESSCSLIFLNLETKPVMSLSAPCSAMRLIIEMIRDAFVTECGSFFGSRWRRCCSWTLTCAMVDNALYDCVLLVFATEMYPYLVAAIALTFGDSVDAGQQAYRASALRQQTHHVPGEAEPRDPERHAAISIGDEQYKYAL